MKNWIVLKDSYGKKRLINLRNVTQVKKEDNGLLCIYFISTSWIMLDSNYSLVTLEMLFVGDNDKE